MNIKTRGIHHVTAMAGDPQKNIDFYAGVLGLRMVKKTINFDDPYTYHFYFGDAAGNPGTIMTFFPWTSRGLRGRKGAGQLTTTAFSVAENALDYWVERLAQKGVETAGPFDRFGESVLTFEDPEGLDIEIVATKNDVRGEWVHGDVPGPYAIRGFHAVTLSQFNNKATEQLMTGLLGFHRVAESDNLIRLASGEENAGTYIDLLTPSTLQRGTMGVGVVHHVAWRIIDDAAQLHIRQELLEAGYQVSPVMDRNYFQSIYFREPGGVLFEIATDPPGFAIDEPAEHLGSALMLPQWLESRREEIEARLPKVKVP